MQEACTVHYADFFCGVGAEIAVLQIQFNRKGENE
jgi:hypothetical protein